MPTLMLVKSVDLGVLAMPARRTDKTCFNVLILNDFIFRAYEYFQPKKRLLCTTDGKNLNALLGRKKKVLALDYILIHCL